MLVELKEELEAAGVRLWLARLHGPVHDLLERSGALQKIGEENIYPRLIAGLLEYLVRATPAGGEDVLVLSDSIQLAMEVIKPLISHSEGEHRQLLESYRQRLEELARAILS
jgi:hypothetical protein